MAEIISYNLVVRGFKQAQTLEMFLVIIPCKKNLKVPFPPRWTTRTFVDECSALVKNALNVVFEASHLLENLSPPAAKSASVFLPQHCWLFQFSSTLSFFTLGPPLFSPHVASSLDGCLPLCAKVISVSQIHLWYANEYFKLNNRNCNSSKSGIIVAITRACIVCKLSLLLHNSAALKWKHALCTLCRMQLRHTLWCYRSRRRRSCAEWKGLRFLSTRTHSATDINN